MSGIRRPDLVDRLGSFALILLGGGGLVMAVNTPIVFRFDEDPFGRPPRGLIFEVTGHGPAVRWEVQPDPTAPSRPHVLAQIGKAQPGNNFPLAVVEGVTVENGEVSVKFKAVGGEEDQAGGLVWRYQDADNYYLARANALEDNYNFYGVKNGKRRLLRGVHLQVTAKVWHTLKVTFRRDVFTLYFDGKMVLTATDQTFTQVGKVGLWTKADSVTFFDDFEILADDTKASR